MASRPDQQDREAPTLPLWAIVGGCALLLLTALAAPFYQQALSAATWAAETLKALCGW